MAILCGVIHQLAAYPQTIIKRQMNFTCLEAEGDPQVYSGLIEIAWHVAFCAVIRCLSLHVFGEASTCH